jgi:hypothetical protein
MFFTMGVGLLQLFGKMNARINQQIEMDQFTGTTALMLRACVLTVEHSESRLQTARNAMIATCSLVPPACPAAQKVYDTLRIVEELIQKEAGLIWNKHRAEWVLKNPLSSKKSALPGLTQTIHTGRLRLNYQQGGLTSTAEIWTNSRGSKPRVWKAAWTE